jgi:hypothetical protein
MALTLDGINVTPRSDTLSAVSTTEPYGPITIAVSQANTAIQGAYISPVQYKIRKIAVYWSATVALGATFNLVVGTGAYTQGNVAGNDNSFDPNAATTVGINGIANTGAVLGGLGYPTNVAVAGNAVFAADVGLTVANFPNASTTGGYGILIPTNYDAVYPAGIPLTLRATTNGTTTITNLTIALAIVPMPLRQSTGIGEVYGAVPGVDY